LDPRFEAVTFAEIEEAVRRHLSALPSAIDSFLEDYIFASSHYRITVDGDPAGFASIHGGSLITQFALAEPFRRHGQQIFPRLRRLEQVTSAFVPTCDEFYLAHALDVYRQLAKQAYFFAEGPDWPSPGSASLRPATSGDVALIREESGDFFQAIDEGIAAGTLFVTERDGRPAGFGIMETSRLYPDVASIGMFTIERFRSQGVGTATIALLRAECHRRGIRPVAGCWYYNHASKRTLERAGMYSPTRLLRMEY
jgi:GNAT superfamily N-acetyltransferase